MKFWEIIIRKGIRNKNGGSLFFMMPEKKMGESIHTGG